MPEPPLELPPEPLPVPPLSELIPGGQSCEEDPAPPWSPPVLPPPAPESAEEPLLSLEPSSVNPGVVPKAIIAIVKANTNIP